jgi:acyl transferase domain-containing protein
MKLVGTSTHVIVQFLSNSHTRYVPSEGAAGLILKTKSAAIRDGDNILAVVRSADVKHDGRSQGLVAPNVKAQIAMQISLLEKANPPPAEIEYVALIFTITVYLLLPVGIYFSSLGLMLILG